MLDELHVGLQVNDVSCASTCDLFGPSVDFSKSGIFLQVPVNVLYPSSTNSLLVLCAVYLEHALAKFIDQAAPIARAR